MNTLEYRAVHHALMCHSHCSCRSVEQVCCTIHQPGGVMLSSQRTAKNSWEPWTEKQRQLNLVRSRSQSNVQQSSHLGVFLVYSNQAKQTQSSSLRGIWQHSRWSSEVSRSGYSELWTVPCTNTRTLAMTHKRRLSSISPESLVPS